MLRRLLAFGLAALLQAVPALAQEFPSRSVIIIVPYPAGGSTDVLARSLAAELAKVWGRPVVVENAPGASSIIGATKAANAAPDGHTLLFTIDSTVVSNRFLHKELPYDPEKSLAPVTMVARGGLFLLANPGLKAGNMRELVDLARRTPQKLAYASSGIATQANLLYETIGRREGVEFLHVPYKGIGPNLTATMSGEVQLTAASLAASGVSVKSGRLKALAITGPKRSALFPDVPTIAESGYPYVDYVIWFGLFAPGGVPPQLIDRIHRDVTGVAKRPEFAEKYVTSAGLELVANTPAEFAGAIRDNVKVVAEMIKAAGVKPE